VRFILLIIFASVTSYYLLFSGPTPRFNIVPYQSEAPETKGDQALPSGAPQASLTPAVPSATKDKDNGPESKPGSAPVGNDAPAKDESEDKSSETPAKDEDDGSIQNGKPSAEEKQHDDHPSNDAPKNEPPKSPSDAEKEQKPLNMDLETYNKEVEMLESWDMTIEELRKWKDPTDKENYDDVAPGYETDGQGRDSGTISRLQHEKDMRKMWRYAYKTTAE
jgi:hypothetical protein